MIEVHTGTRAGRPTVLIVISAVALVGALGLAWTQVQLRQALGEPTQIADKPMIVRSPVGWVENPRGSGMFVKPVRKRVWGREVWAAERRIEFHYNDFLQQFTQLFRVSSAASPIAVDVAGWKGAQYLLTKRGQRWAEQSVFRWMRTPWGGQVSVEYTPLGEVSHGDLDLLDRICDQIDFDATALRISPSEALSYAGISWAVPSGWEVLGTQYVGGPGFCVADDREPVPTWALTLFRRSLRRGITPAQYLGQESLASLGIFVRPAVQRREDGAYVAYVGNPAATGRASTIVSLWLIVKSSREAAVIYVMASPPNAKLADAAADQLTRSLEFESAFPW